MGTVSVSELLNLVGLSTGVVLYAMLLAMVVRAGRCAATAARASIRCCSPRRVLGLVWNLCALPAYELPKVGIEGPFPYLIADRLLRARISAGGRRPLGPARRRDGSARRAGTLLIAAAAYAVSAIALAAPRRVRRGRAAPCRRRSACGCSPTRSSRSCCRWRR